MIECDVCSCVYYLYLAGDIVIVFKYLSRVASMLVEEGYR